MPLDRTWYNTLVDDDGSGSVGSVWDKADVNALMNAIDAELTAAGSWTPVIGGSGGTSGQSYTIQAGQWVRSGHIVLASFYAVLSAKGTITGDLQIQGLPVAVRNAANQYATLAVGHWSNLATALVALTGFGIPGTTSIALRGSTAATTGLTALTTANLANNSEILGSLFYITA